MPLQPDPLRIPGPKRKFDRARVDGYANRFLNSADTQLQISLDAATKACEDADVPDWSTIASQGKFIQMQCQILQAQRVLEIGTLGGHSAIWCAFANEQLTVTTIEAVPEYAAVAMNNFKVAGVSDRVELLQGTAHDVLPKLHSEMDSGNAPKYDLVLIDVDGMTDLWEFFEATVDLCRPGGCILTHCALSPSNIDIAPFEEANSRVRGSRVFMERVGADERVNSSLLMCSGQQEYDILIAVVRYLTAPLKSI